MTKSQRLRPVVKITEKKERSAAITVAENKRVLDEQMSKLEHLKTYLDEYRGVFRAQGAAGFTVQRMQEYRIFLSNLEAAVTQQQLIVKNYQALYEDSIKIWRISRGKVKALDTVIARHEKKERQEDMRRDQKELDDRPKLPGHNHEEEK